jgi:hypothetical protein
MKTSVGINGTMNLRVAYTDAMEGIPKMMAVFTLINPCLYFGKAPTNELAPTTKSEYAVAKIGSTPNKYTKTGTVKMDPPPPIRPSEIPMSSEAKSIPLFLSQASFFFQGQKWKFKTML